jgi:tetratricopeptide (TPR) repeat protein
MQPFYAQAVAGLSAYDKSKYNDEQREAARLGYEKARELSLQGKWKEAIAVLKISYAIVPAPLAMYAFGTYYQATQDLPSSLYWYEKFLEEAPNSKATAGNDVLITSATNQIALLKREVGKATNWVVPAVIGSAAFIVVLALVKSRGASMAEA